MPSNRYGRFLPAAEADRETPDWGQLAWLSRPATTGAKQLTVIEVTLAPGGGHDFHRHPRQEEVIYVVAGQVEQWLGPEKRVLKAGDSVYIHANQVHASFNVFKADAKVLAILGPCAGEAGYELEDVSKQAPWKSLRT
ncbi:MAG: cupin domain-containing protein [Planctomycetota bacterium]|nr:cupin domain-containing protein [Planctomycetota bacterium]